MERSKMTWSSFNFTNETDFEQIIIQKDILKNYYVYNAKKTLNIFRKYNRYADVLLIQKNFKYWSIGEVEISKHSFKNHIFPQIIEIYTLMEENVDFIRQNYLEIQEIDVSKEIEDLIKFNKPFLNLVIDKIPASYNNILPLLNSFCNVNLVQRLRDSEENYVYLNDDYYRDSIKKAESNCFINERILIIENPNLLDLQKIEKEYLYFANKKISIRKQFNKVGGKDKLFWIMELAIPVGKYRLRNQNNELILFR